MFSYLDDHGLPLVQLKEQRRDLVVALVGYHGLIPRHVIGEIAAVQQTVAAIEAVIADLDAEFQSPNQKSEPPRTFPGMLTTGRPRKY